MILLPFQLESGLSYISKSLLHSGVIIKVIKEAFALEGIQTKIIFYPWSRAYQNAKKGIVDATAIWYHSQEREEHFHYSIPVVHNEYVFFHLANFDFNWNTINDLKDIKIGATLEYTYSDEFHKAFNDGWLDVQWVPTDLQNFKKLFLHRIELFPLEREPGYFLLNKHFTEKEINLITYHPKPLRSGSLSLLFNKKIKKNEKMLKLFNSGLLKLKESGKFDQYLRESQRGDYIIEDKED